MITLAIESSTQVASVALVKDSVLLLERVSDNPRAHSEFIHPAIEELLKETRLSLEEINRLAVDIGPGSFTGIRVAVNVVRTFAYLKNIPIFVRKSLDLLLDQTDQNSVAMINAYKNMIFISLKIDGRLIADSEIIPANGLAQFLKDRQISSPMTCIGDGYAAYQTLFSNSLGDILIRKAEFSDFPSAATLGAQASNTEAKTLDWKSVIPLYLRGSAAEENLKSKQLRGF